MDEALSRAVLADEDVEGDPDRWCSHAECGQELWQTICQWIWNLRLALGHTLQGGEQREIEWAPPKEATRVFVEADSTPEEYGPWQKAAEKGRARGRFGAKAFVLQENGTLRCPAGASLWLSEVRQETPVTQRAIYLARPVGLSVLFLSGTMLGARSQEPSCPPRQRGPSSSARSFGGDPDPCRGRLDALGRCRWSSATPHLDGPLAWAIRRGTPA